MNKRTVDRNILGFEVVVRTYCVNYNNGESDARENAR